MTYTNTPKIAGNPCSDCGAKLVKSPKTGKIFCEKKCWLNKPQGHPTQDVQDDVIRVPENIKIEDNKPDQSYWEAKDKRFADGQREGVLTKVAADFTIAMFDKGMIDGNAMVSTFNQLLKALKATN